MNYAEYLFAVLIGAVQGLTEWLPISSSGHLLLVHKCLAVEPSAFIVAITHLGTLSAVLFLYRENFVKIIVDFMRGGEKRIVGFKIIIGSIPVIVVGFLFDSIIEDCYSTPSKILLSICFLITALFLFLTRLAGKATKKDISIKDSIIIGLAQTLSLLPGISRSGITISTGIILKIEREASMIFSIYLSTIVIFGASILEIIKLGPDRIDLTFSIIVFIVSFTVGYLALIVLRKFTFTNNLHLFGIYCVLIAILILTLF